MKRRKKSLYQSKIESLKNQSETESQTIKELLSPAAYEKLNQAQSSLLLSIPSQGSTRRYKLLNYDAVPADPEPPKDVRIEVRKPQSTLRRYKLVNYNAVPADPEPPRADVTIEALKPQSTSRRYKLLNYDAVPSDPEPQKADKRKIEPYKPRLIKIAKKEPVETLQKRRQTTARQLEVKGIKKESVETIENRLELQEALAEIENEVRTSQLASPMQHKSWSFQIESKEFEVIGNCVDEPDSFEFWEPKVELLEAEDDALAPDSVNESGSEEFEKDPNDLKELPTISYVAVEQLPRLIGLQNESKGVELTGQPQIIRVSAVPGAQNDPGIPISYVPLDQLSNYYVLS